MPHVDLPLEELRSFAPPLSVPDDFDAFWRRTLAEASSFSLDVTRHRAPTPLRSVEVHDLTYRGWGGHPVSAWLVLPAERSTDVPLPCVVEFVGYGGGRGRPHESLVWASAGYAHLVMDTRGQGSVWRAGATSDPGADGAPAAPGMMTRGIEDPERYYYRRVFADAVRAVEAARSLPEVDPGRVVVTGRSQGGGIALAAAALVPDLLAAMVDVPFLCAMRRATEMTDRDPYAEIARYLGAHRHRVEQVFATLAYFDGCHLATRASAPALFSVGLRDDVCPPSTGFAAFNSYAGPDKEIRVWHYNGHEGGGADQTAEQLAWLEPRAWHG